MKVYRKLTLFILKLNLTNNINCFGHPAEIYQADLLTSLIPRQLLSHQLLILFFLITGITRNLPFESRPFTTTWLKLNLSRDASNWKYDLILSSHSISSTVNQPISQHFAVFRSGNYIKFHSPASSGQFYGFYFDRSGNILCFALL